MYILGNIYHGASRVIGKTKALAGSHAAFANAGQAMRGALAALRTWRERRAAILEIGALPDRLLVDIGLNRADIDAKVTAQLGKLRSQAGAERNRAGAPAGSFEAAAC